jgi:hypothetical protein
MSTLETSQRGVTCRRSLIKLGGLASLALRVSTGTFKEKRNGFNLFGRVLPRAMVRAEAYHANCMLPTNHQSRGGVTFVLRPITCLRRHEERIYIA